MLVGVFSLFRVCVLPEVDYKMQPAALHPLPGMLDELFTYHNNITSSHRGALFTTISCVIQPAYDFFCLLETLIWVAHVTET